MELNAATLWWIAAGALVAAEMTTGTFYLLMLAFGAAAAAIGAHLGLGLGAQLLLAAALGGGALLGWHLFQRRRRSARPDAAPRGSLPLDIGERVRVTVWHADGSARIDYRGAQWNARYAGDGQPEPGEFFIRGFEGNRLLLGR